MRPWKQYTKTIAFNDKDLEVSILVFVEPSDLSLEDVIGDAEDFEDLSRKIKNGSLEIMDIRVEARALGIEGFDSLGGCYISRPEDVNSSLIDHDLEALAIDHLKECIRVTYDQLKQYF